MPKRRSQIFKIFYDTEVIHKCPEYDIVFSEQDPYPHYNRLANYNADDCSTEYIRNVMESAEKYLLENVQNIDGLFVKLDIEAVIMSALLSRLNINKKYASYESVFCCNHKYYQRVNEQNPIEFNYIDVDENEGKILPQFPFFFKAPELQMSVHQYVITDVDQLKEIIKKLRIELPNYNADTKYINEHYLNLKKYPGRQNQ